MKKHIIGLAIFSFIVSAAAIVYAVLSVPEIVSVSEPQYILAERTHCKTKRQLRDSEVKSPIVTQAIYNVKTKKLSWQSNEADLGRGTVLHWVLVDEKGIQKLSSFFAKDYVKDSQGNYEVNYPFPMLDETTSKVNPKANLYLVVDTKSSNGINTEARRMIEFDLSKAIPVTVDYGE